MNSLTLGIPREIKPNEGRVAATPELVKMVTDRGVRVLVESGAGLRSRFPDSVYRKAGARIVANARNLWKRSDVVLKVKEPLGPEIRYLRPDLVLVCFLHLAAAPGLTAELLRRGTVAIGLETVLTADGQAPVLIPMSEVAGRMAILESAYALAKHPAGMGKYIGGTTGVPPADVVVIGAGAVGREAVRIAVGMEARVTVVDPKPEALSRLQNLYPGKIETRQADAETIAGTVTAADIVVAAAYRAGERAPVLITRKLVKRMRKGSVIVDVAIDQGGCVETSKAGTHTKPIQVIDGVLHYAVPNMPGAVPLTSTLAFSAAVGPHLLRLVEGDPRLVIYQDPVWRSGLNTDDHELIHHGVQKAYYSK